MNKYNRLTERKEDREYLQEEFWYSANEPSVEEIDEIYKRLAELEDKIENGILIEEKSCVWEEWQDGNFGSAWQCSNCKEDFCFMEGGVNENMYGYCPNCGAKIVAIKELKDEEIGEE